MEDYYGDFHIHIGRASGGEAVKITASPQLDFAGIARESVVRKGLDMVGIIDCASPPVIRDIKDLLSRGEMEELPEGGLRYREELVIILGAEVESREKGGGQAHYLAYFPYLDNLSEFSQIMEQYITNINLSSQSTGLEGREIFQIVNSTGGVLIPAHAFTPHKSFYGSCVKTFTDIFTPHQWEQIPALELGLSADSNLAAHLEEVSDKVFLSNSDAHSLPKIAREYNKIRMAELNFSEFKKVLFAEDGRKVTGNYGLDPRLGKYHRSFCPDCEKSFSSKEPVLVCPKCGQKSLIKGVKDRVLNIGQKPESGNGDYPPYIYQVPLLDIPGIGEQTLKRLLGEFNTEMEILHNTELNELKKAVSPKLAEKIELARNGRAEIKQGGGGNYGKVKL